MQLHISPVSRLCSLMVQITGVHALCIHMFGIIPDVCATAYIQFWTLQLNSADHRQCHVYINSKHMELRVIFVAVPTLWLVQVRGRWKEPPSPGVLFAFATQTTPSWAGGLGGGGHNMMSIPNP